MLLIQAGLSAAFIKTLDNAEEEDDEFHDGVYDGKAVLYFRVPNKACVEERTYLAKMSRFGTKESREEKIAACPGIERALKEEEKKMMLRKVQEEVEGGEKVIYLAAALFVRPDKVEENSGEEDEGSVVDVAMKNLGDDGFLVLEHVYRKKVGRSILIGDKVVEGEEEEEEEEDDQEPEEERTSLVVTLRYRKD